MVKIKQTPLSRLIFLAGNVIELDGFCYHQEGTRQAERDLLKNSKLGKCGVAILRFRTNESGEEKRLIDKLSEVLSRNALDKN